MLTTSLLDCSVWSAGMGAPTQQKILWIACVASSEDIKTLSIGLLLLYITSAACQKDLHVQHCMILQQLLSFEPETCCVNLACM